MPSVICQYRGCRERGTATYVTGEGSDVVFSFHVCPAHRVLLGEADRDQVEIEEIAEGEYDVRVLQPR